MISKVDPDLSEQSLVLNISLKEWNNYFISFFTIFEKEYGRPPTRYEADMLVTYIKKVVPMIWKKGELERKKRDIKQIFTNNPR